MVARPAGGLSAKRFAGLFVSLAVLCGVWSVASPPGAVPDEYMHYKYAYALWSGQVTRTSTDYVVPATLALPRQTCYAQRPDVTAECSIEEVVASGSQGPERVATTANLYPPLFYALTGWTVRLSPDDAGIIGGRLVGALFCCLLTVLAVDRLYRFAGATTMVAFLLCLTPMTVYFFAAFNPQGIELSLALLLIAATAQLSIQGKTPGRSGWILFFIAAIGLSIGRPFGFAWVPLIVALIASPMWMLGHRIRRSEVVMGLGASMVLGLMWMFTFSVPDPSRTNPGTTLSALLSNSYGRLMQFPLEWVGNFGHLDTPLPLPVPALWFAAVGAVIALGLASKRIPLVLSALLTVPIGLALALSMEYRTESGWGWVVIQGRYLLPFLFVFVLLLGFAADSVSLPVMARFVAVLVLMWSVIQLWSMLELLRRNMFGQSANPLTTDSTWQPAINAWTIIAWTVISVSLFAAAYRCTALDRRGRGLVGERFDGDSDGGGVWPLEVVAAEEPENVLKPAGALPSDKG